MGKRVRVNLFKFVLLLLSSTLLLAASPNILKNAEVAKGELRLVFSKTIEKEDVKQMTLPKPYRRVFDIKNTRLENPKIFKKFGSKLKIAQYKPNIVRVVIQNERPYSCTPYKPIFTKKEYHIPLPKNIKYLFSPQASTAKLNIEVKDQKVPNVKAKKVVKKYQKPLKSARAGGLIVIDAGHGGHDSGAVGGGKKEKDLVLSISKRVAKDLKKRGYRVHMTRTRDRFLKLSERTHIADKKGAVAFVSIHANSVAKKNSKKVHGVETFFLQNTRDKKSQRIAARENAAVLKGAGSKLSKNVIIDAVLNGPKIIESNKLAIDVQRRIITNLKKHYRGVRDGGVRHGPFYVLVGASRPSVLVEVGYISHPRERSRLFNTQYQSLLSRGIAEGIDNYLINRKKEIDL